MAAASIYSPDNSWTNLIAGEAPSSVLSGLPVRCAMVSNFESLAPTDPPQHAAQAIIEGSQLDFPVLRNGRLLGILPRRDLLAALVDPNRIQVGEFLLRQIPSLHPDEMLEPALSRFAQCGSLTMPVIADGQLVGLLTIESLAKSCPEAIELLHARQGADSVSSARPVRHADSVPMRHRAA